LVYGTLANIKILCGIEASEASFDTALTMCLSKADDFINNALAPYDSVPLAYPGAVIVDIAEYYAAGLYMQRNIPDEKKHSYLMFDKEWPRDCTGNYGASSSARESLCRF
jgi:hypothetical protein